MGLKTVLLDNDKDRTMMIHRTMNDLLSPLDQLETAAELHTALKGLEYGLILICADVKGLNIASLVKKIRQANSDTPIAIYSDNKTLNPDKLRFQYMLSYPPVEDNWKTSLNDLLEDELATDVLLEEESESEISLEILEDDDSEEVDAEVILEDDGGTEELDVDIIEEDTSASIGATEELSVDELVLEETTDTNEIIEPAQVPPPIDFDESPVSPQAADLETGDSISVDTSANSQIELKALQQELATLKKIAADEKVKAARFDIELKKLRHENEVLSNELGKLTEERLNMEVASSSFGGQKKDFEKAIHKLREENAKLLADKETLEDSLKDSGNIESEMEELKNEKSSLQSENQNLQKEVEELNSKLGVETGEKKKLKENLDKIKALCEF